MIFRSRDFVRILLVSVLFSIMSAGAAFAAGVISLPKTGQTACYDSSGAETGCAGTGQDGEIQGGASWPVARFTVGTGAEAECITDNLTGLVWAKNGNLANSTKTWQGALAYITSMNSGAGLCGHNDWRLPNINEIESLISAGGVNSVVAWLNAQGFSSLMADFYWSSTVYSGDTANIFDMKMSTGSITLNSGSSGSDYFLPVRTGQATAEVHLPKTGQTSVSAAGDDGSVQAGFAWPGPRFTDTGEQTVVDNLTGLIWAKDAAAPTLTGTASTCAGGTKTWQEALNYIKCLNTNNYLGRNDWKLPDKNEMRSIVDYSRVNPSLPAGNPFSNVQSAQYWSSSSPSGYSAQAFYIAMNNGEMNRTSKTEHFSAWPVRGAGQITVSRSGAGVGTVTSSPSGINCGTVCNAYYESGSQVVLTAAAAVDSLFAGWSGCDSMDGNKCSVTVSGAKSVAATFDLANAADAPSIVATVPAAGSEGNRRNTIVKITFNQDVDASTVTPDNIRIDGNAAGSLVYDAANKAAVFHPSANLSAGAVYTVTVAAGIKGINGVSRSTAHVFSFTTGPDLEAPGGWININNSAESAGSRNVVLTVHADSTFASISMMRFSNDNASWSDWENYGTSTDWALPAGAGSKTVYAQFKDSAGNVSSGNISDSIILDTSRLAYPRVFHTAVLMPDGPVMVAGGTTSDGSALKSAEIFNPVTETSSPAGDMAFARTRHTATLLPNGTVLVAGGSDGVSSLSSAEIYNPATGRFTTTQTNMSAARAGHTATLLENGKVLIAGGSDGAVALRGAEIFDPAAGLFSTAGEMKTARSGHSATLLKDGSVLISGGINGAVELGAPTNIEPGSALPAGLKFLSSLESFDPATGGFTDKGTLNNNGFPIECAGCSPVLLKDGGVFFYSAPGNGGGVVYNPDSGSMESNSWGMVTWQGPASTATALPSGNILFSLDDIGNKSTVLSDRSHSLIEFELPLPLRAYKTATLLNNGKVVFIGGWNAGALNTVYIYDTGDALPAAQHTLTVAKSPTGGGTVTSSPAGINCGPACSSGFSQGTVVTLTAAPDAGSVFTGWSGAGCAGAGTCVITVNADANVTATFDVETTGGSAFDPAKEASLTVTKGGAGSGNVNIKSSDGQSDCDSGCGETGEVFKKKTKVTLTAKAGDDSYFAGWTGDCKGAKPVCSVTLTKDLAVTAKFELKYVLTVKASGTGSGTVKSSPSGINCGDACDMPFMPKAKVTLTARPGSNSAFSDWTGAAGCAAKPVCMVTMASAKTVTAAFAALNPVITVTPASLSFGTAAIAGKTVSKTLLIKNSGTGNLVISSVSVDGDTDGSFSTKTSGFAAIKPKKTYKLTVKFKPKTAGQKTATLTINSNDPDHPASAIVLSGAAVAGKKKELWEQ